MKLSAVAFRSIAWDVCDQRRGCSASRRSSEVCLARTRGTDYRTFACACVDRTVASGRATVICPVSCVLDTRETGDGELYNSSIHDEHTEYQQRYIIRGLSPPRREILRHLIRSYRALAQISVRSPPDTRRP